MSLSKSLTTVAVLGMAASAATAGITPSWRINTISPAAMAESPGLANAVSVSLLVSLTGSSLFNVAGLDITGLLPGATVFNHAAGVTANSPNPLFFAIFPGVQFDTYVTGTDPATNQTTPVSVPGKLNGTGPADFGPATFNVAWGATPNTGPAGGSNLEILRLTLQNVFASPTEAGTPIPAGNGQVRSSDDPNTPIPLPPIPVVIPEPTMGLALAGLGILALRRK